MGRVSSNLQGRSDGDGYRYLYPPKSTQVNFLWGKNDVRTARPVSESESERQRARNGVSESERDFSRERATIHTSESKRVKFIMGRDFSFYSALQWSSCL